MMTYFRNRVQRCRDWFTETFVDRAWHCTNAKADASFNPDRPMPYRQAVKEIRKRYPGARVVRVDWEWSVIFFIP